MTIDPFVLLAPVLLLAVVALLRFVGCNQLFGLVPATLAPSQPVVLSISPTFETQGHPDFTIKVTGTNFVENDSVVQWNGSNRDTAFKSVTELWATITTADIATAGMATVTVVTPDASPDTTSNAVTFNIRGAAIGFVQVNAGTPPTPPNVQSVLVALLLPQTAGNLNIVVVGWNDATSDVASVRDSNNNPYLPAIGPTRGTSLSQRIYYATNILPGTNSVTVTFNQAVPFPDVRVLEYTGVTGPDGPGAEASGSSATASCGPVTTSVANELIFAANTVATHTSAADPSFTQRIITNPDGDLAEDRIVSAIETRSASDPLTAPGPWVMQMVAFK